ncbi:hypothetical protein [Rhodohalobacter mucosus]|uniref:Uncharacterized protein n=1 Tax=Rhodohalobacter mucosus TaxID=2079485 RepID=A0A316TU80_9BACT|nr:hypothetical protein [Rhodohalobacter mucosus]PWN05862.1 hypothetical protein DDZ15_11785 [Rhodohalobacter mucosus]
MSIKYRGSDYDSYDSRDPLDDYLDKAERRAIRKEHEGRRSGNSNLRNFAVIFIIALAGVFVIRGVQNFSISPIPDVIESITNPQPSEDLLNRMNALMIEMGYTDLTNEQLTELRSQGVTATYISNIRSLGYEDLTLEDAVRLSQADVSSTFTAMLQELGYEPTVEDLINLRRADVTAFYTSNIHDLGYRDVTFDQLIRMQRIGVSPELISQLQAERGEDLPLEEIIRYRISNQ